MNIKHPHTISAFRDFIPRWLKIILFLCFSVVFQFSNTTYLSLMGTITGAHQLLKEDFNFFFQMTMIGICFIFPLLFRFKLRFTSQQMIIGCSLVIMAMLLVVTVSDSVPIIATASFILGAAKMLGTFETLVSLQLIITPNRDYGVFFSVALGIVLSSGQISGIWAANLNYDYDWKLIYKIMIAGHALVILLTLFLLRPMRVAKKLPLYGIDWLGFFLWSCLFISLTYVFTYGQILDWFNSEKIQVGTWLSLLFAILTIIRIFQAKRPYVNLKTFSIGTVHIAIGIMLVAQLFLCASGSVLGPFTMGVLHLDDLHSSGLNWWITAGIILGAIFCYYWFLKINGSFKIFFILSFAALTGYYFSLYFLLGNYADQTILFVPYILRGFGNMLIFTGVGKYITKNVSLNIFTHVLCYLAMARNALGSLIPSSVIGYIEYRRTADYYGKISSKIDQANTSASSLFQNTYHQALLHGRDTQEASILASKTLFSRVNQQAILLAGREIFGIMTLLGLVTIVVLTTIHFGRPFLSKIPSWRKIRVISSDEGEK